jgi:triacylglycerol lipase
MKTLLLGFLITLGALAQTPIIFVHGNGDDSTKWIPTIWMFESNGYPSARLHAVRFTDPSARRDNSKPELWRSSTTDQASELAAAVTRVLIETGASKVALVGSSRGGMTIRNYLKNGGGAAHVSHAVLCGTPNHGVLAMDGNLDFEFNGKGRFLRQLNEPSELVDGVQFLTIRSDKADKYAQPNVGYDSPELKGARNVVLPGLDHREVAFHPQAFSVMYEFITGKAPQSAAITAQPSATLSGLITGFGAGAATNRPLAGVHFRVWALKPASADRDGAPLIDITSSEAGVWGPLTADPKLTYEFSLEKDGRTVTYFMSGFERSTNILNFRYVPTGGAPGKLIIHRPQGYLSSGRDPVTLNDKPVAEVPAGVPTVDSVTVSVEGTAKVVLRSETIYARPSTSATELNFAELLKD